LERQPRASNLATNLADDVAVHHRDDRVRDQRPAAAKLDYLEEERRIPREQLDAVNGGKKLSFTADLRRRLAVAAKVLTPTACFETRRT
jgi:hypothetical protein